jgi:hypothetical protein
MRIFLILLPNINKVRENNKSHEQYPPLRAKSYTSYEAFGSGHWKKYRDFQNGLMLRIHSSSRGYGLALEANLRGVLKRLIYNGLCLFVALVKTLLLAAQFCSFYGTSYFFVKIALVGLVAFTNLNEEGFDIGAFGMGRRPG